MHTSAATPVHWWSGIPLGFFVSSLFILPLQPPSVLWKSTHSYLAGVWPFDHWFFAYTLVGLGSNLPCRHFLWWIVFYQYLGSRIIHIKVWMPDCFGKKSEDPATPSPCSLLISAGWSWVDRPAFLSSPRSPPPTLDSPPGQHISPPHHLLRAFGIWVFNSCLFPSLAFFFSIPLASILTQLWALPPYSKLLHVFAFLSHAHLCSLSPSILIKNHRQRETNGDDAVSPLERLSKALSRAKWPRASPGQLISPF